MSATPPPLPSAPAPAPDAGPEHHYVSERQKRDKLKTQASMQPPLTPMIDVVFQLLLFFLLGCRFIQEEGQIRANLPKISGPAVASMRLEPIKIQLTATGLNDDGVMIEITGAANQTLGEVPKVWDFLMNFKRRAQPGVEEVEVPVIITPRGRVRWTFVVDAFNQAIRAKYKNVGFAPPGA